MISTYLLQQKILAGLGLRLFHPDLPGSPDGVLVVARLVVVQHVRQGDGSLGLKVKVSDPAPVLRRNLTVDRRNVLLLLGELLHNGARRVTWREYFISRRKNIRFNLK